MKLIVGLGNPGRQYEATRHNVGWWVLDYLADRWQCSSWRKDNEAQICDGMFGSIKIRLLKPQTYMNLSGTALRPYVKRPFWSPKTDMLVVVDEVALPVGRFRVRPKGSAGGHNGLKHIEHTLKSQEYPRLRIGVGPNDPQRILPDDLADYVLAPFGKMERAEILDLFPTLALVCESWLRDGTEKTMNLYNGK